MSILSTKEATVSARINQSEKDKQTGYNTRQAIEYFNSVFSDELESLKIEKYFLLDEIEESKLKLKILEHQLEEIIKMEKVLSENKLNGVRIKNLK